MEKMKHQPWKKRELKSQWRVEKLKFLFSCMEIFRNKKNLSWEEIFPQLKSPQLITELVKDHYPSKAFNMTNLRAFVLFVNHQQRDHPKLRQELATTLIGLGAPKNLAAEYINGARGASPRSNLTLGSPGVDTVETELMVDVDGNDNEHTLNVVKIELDDENGNFKNVEVDQNDPDKSVKIETLAKRMDVSKGLDEK